jgi:hypothetical protein
MCLRKLLLQGTGKKKMEEELTLLEVKYPRNARGIAKFNVPLAHMMFAGADYIIIPSRFEPCGLIQLQGMRYGVVKFLTSLFWISNLIRLSIRLSVCHCEYIKVLHNMLLNASSLVISQ